MYCVPELTSCHTPGHVVCSIYDTITSRTCTATFLAQYSSIDSKCWQQGTQTAQASAWGALKSNCQIWTTLGGLHTGKKRKEVLLAAEGSYPLLGVEAWDMLVQDQVPLLLSHS